MPVQAPGAVAASGSAARYRSRRLVSVGLRAMVALLFLATSCVAQMYSADDKAGLLAFHDGGDPAVGDGASWALDSEPCDEGWYSRDAGWLAIDCNAPGSLGGRVTQIRAVTAGLSGECLFAGIVGALAQVDAVVTIDLQGCDGVGGQIGPLASLAHLTFLSLGDTSVTGAVEQLAGLSGLLTLQLAGSSVYGDITTLKAVPGLGATWAGFDACSAHSCLLTRLLGIDALIAASGDFAGTDDCTCCTDSCMAIGNAFCVPDLEGGVPYLGYVTRPTWTPWLSRDCGGGYGDSEGPGADWACANPVAIQCETNCDTWPSSRPNCVGTPWNETGQVFQHGCTVDEGLVCFSSQNDGACLDYRIRLLCPATHTDRVRLGDVVCAPAYSPVPAGPGAECAADGAASNLTGCEENTCDVMAEDEVVGYDLINPVGNTVSALDNVTCTAGYTNKTGYTAGPLVEYENGTLVGNGPPFALCRVDAGEFELEGCRENICGMLTDETLGMPTPWSWTNRKPPQAGYVVANSTARTVLTLSNVRCAYGYYNPVPVLPSYQPRAYAGVNLMFTGDPPRLVPVPDPNATKSTDSIAQQGNGTNATAPVRFLLEES